MHHRLASTGWSLPGGVTHAIASWGFLWPAGLWGPTWFHDHSRRLAFARAGRETAAANLTPAVACLSAGEERGFIDSRQVIAPLCRTSRVAFRDDTVRHAAHCEHGAVAFGDETVSLSFADATEGAGFAGLTPIIHYVPRSGGA